jgi:hypothetical protein
VRRLQRVRCQTEVDALGLEASKVRSGGVDPMSDSKPETNEQRRGDEETKIASGQFAFDLEAIWLSVFSPVTKGSVGYNSKSDVGDLWTTCWREKCLKMWFCIYAQSSISLLSSPDKYHHPVRR